eukprot:3896294-Prymnesium_polylepis.3
MREAQDEHGEQHRCAEDLLHEGDHLLKQGVQLQPIRTSEDASEVLVRAMRMRVLIVRIDESVMHLKLDERRLVPASHPKVVQEVAKVRRICTPHTQGVTHHSLSEGACWPLACALMGELLESTVGRRWRTDSLGVALVLGAHQL